MVLSNRDDPGVRRDRGRRDVVAGRRAGHGRAGALQCHCRQHGQWPFCRRTLFVNIERWSSAREREKLVTAFRTRGQAQLLQALEKSPKVGSSACRTRWPWICATPSRRHCRTADAACSGDRPSDRLRGRSQRIPEARYPFTLIEIRFDPQGVGVGKMSLYARIALEQRQAVDRARELRDRAGAADRRAAREDNRVPRSA